MRPAGQRIALAATPALDDTVVICGAGAAGVAAALAAARSGRRVLLVETAAQIGGTVAHVLIHTIGGLYDAAGRYLNDGLARELAETLVQQCQAALPRRIGRVWVLSVCPTAYLSLVQAWIAGEARIRTLTGARVAQVGVEGGRITSVAVQKAAGGSLLRLRPRAVVDATGSGEVARLVGAGLVEDRPAPAAGGLIFRLGGVAKDALAVPKGVALVRALHEAAAQGVLPPGVSRAWLDRGCRDDEVYVKLLVPLGPSWRQADEQARALALALGDQAAIVGYLRGVAGFARAEVTATGRLGVRDGGRVVGDYTLTGEDVRAARKFADAACRCAWPIEFWHPERGVTLEYLPDGESYDIPLRALRARDVRNLWVGGKCLSADAQAQASARVAATCWAMGEAAGRAAACS